MTFLLDRPVPLRVTQGPLQGLEFTASLRVGLKDHFRMAALIARLGDVTDEAEAAALLTEAAAILAPRLRSWNLETEAGPLPIGTAELLDIGPGPFSTILGLWHAAVRNGGPDPLASAPRSSASTESSSTTASSRPLRRPRTRR